MHGMWPEHLDTCQLILHFMEVSERHEVCFWNHQPLSDHNLSVCRAAQRRHGPPSKLYTASCPLNLSSHIKEGQNRQDPTTHGTGAPLPLSGRLSHILASLIWLQDVSKVSAFQSDAQAKWSKKQPGLPSGKLT